MMKSKLLILVLIAGTLLYSCNRLKNLTWSEDISPIIHQKCSPCHNNNYGGHFRLVNYDEVKKRAAQIKFVVNEHMMPPWPADPHYVSFANQMLLSDDEIEKITLWVDANCPMGTSHVDTPQFSNSHYGIPDTVIPVKPIFIKGDGRDNFLIVKVPFELGKEHMAQCIEFIPGVDNLVHHVNGDLITYQEGEKSDIYGGEWVISTQGDVGDLTVFEKMSLPNDDGTYPSLTKSVVNYLPGVYPAFYPEELGGVQLTRKNVFLLNDIHYGGIDKDAWDSCYINIYYRKSPIERRIQEFQMGTLGISPIEPELKIPPNKVSTYYSKFKVPIDISLLTINPHMHLLGREFLAFALTPTLDTIRLISIPKWNFKWQYFYTFQHPVKIPAGSTIVAKGVYDNTSNNLLNPNNPPKMVSDSTQSMRTSDEMFQFIINFVEYKPGDEKINLNHPFKK